MKVGNAYAFLDEPNRNAITLYSQTVRPYLKIFRSFKSFSKKLGQVEHSGLSCEYNDSELNDGIAQKHLFYVKKVQFYCKPTIRTTTLM